MSFSATSSDVSAIGANSRRGHNQLCHSRWLPAELMRQERSSRNQTHCKSSHRGETEGVTTSEKSPRDGIILMSCDSTDPAYGANQGYGKSDWRPNWWLLAPASMLKDGSTGN
jgi:hypothetical protein